MNAEIDSAKDRRSSSHKTMTVIEHLEEFRTRLIRCIVIVVIFSFFAYSYSQDLIEWMKHEFCPELKTIVFTKPLDLFMIRLKVAIYLSILCGVPYILFELWQFIAPALFKRERNPVAIFAMISSAFFVIGGVFALFFIYPSVMRLSIEMSSEDIVPMISVDSFVSLAALLILGFGVMFQLPVIIFILTTYKLVKIETLAKARPYFIVIVFIVSAILTPPDVLSQTAMALPTLVLFEISLLASRIFLKIKGGVTQEQ